MTAYLSELTAIIDSKESFSFHEMINFTDCTLMIMI